MDNIYDSRLSPEQRVGRFFGTALALGATVEWESGQPTTVILRGEVVPRLLAMAPMSREHMELVLRSILDAGQWKTFELAGVIEFLHAPDYGAQGLKVRAVTDARQLRVTAHPLPIGESEDYRGLDPT